MKVCQHQDFVVIHESPDCPVCAMVLRLGIRENNKLDPRARGWAGGDVYHLLSSKGFALCSNTSYYALAIYIPGDEYYRERKLGRLRLCKGCSRIKKRKKTRV